MVKGGLASKILMIVVVISCVLVSPRSSEAAEPGWWNASYSQRLGVTVQVGDALPSGYSIAVTLNHASMISAGQSLASGNDVRMVRFDGTTWTELDRVLAIGSSWNSATTKIYFKSASALAAGTFDTSYYLYFGNASAGTPPANPNNVYTLFDDFSSPSLDTSKWHRILNSQDASVENANGQLVVTGKETTSGFGYNGIASNIGTYNKGFAVESTYTSIAQSSTTAMNHKMMFGYREHVAAVKGLGSLPSALSYYSGPPNYWNNAFGSSSVGASITGPHRLLQTRSAAGLLRHWENGTLIGSRFDASATNTNLSIAFGPENNQVSNTFEVRYDDIVVRKFVENEPVTTLAISNTAAVGTIVDPSLTYSVAGGNAACGAITSTPGTNASSTTVSLGRIGVSGSMQTQTMNLATNAGRGWTVLIRSDGPMRTSTGSALAGVSGTNAAPQDFPASGTEAFGYSTTDASLGTGTVNRFPTSLTKWAALENVDREVWYANPGATVGGICMGYKAQTSAITPAGSYATRIFYTAVVTY